MGVQPYDITKYQPILFAADGMEHLMDALGGFFSRVRRRHAGAAGA